MKNFPHQYIDFAKLRATLQTVHDLVLAGKDAAEDEVLGYELARRAVYRFGGLDYDAAGLKSRLESRIAEEKRKDPSSQGARTAARDVRRTIRELGWIDSSQILTPLGNELLPAPLGGPEERDILVLSLAALRLADSSGNESHPALVLLRLIRDHKFTSRDGMEMALEARDDTDGEYRRIEQLLGLSRSARLTKLGVSKYQFDNAVKILPSLALQAGLITQDSAGAYVLTPTGNAVLAGTFQAGRHITPPPATNVRRAGAKRGWSHTSVTSRTVGRRRLARRRARSTQEQVETTQLLVERTDRHQALVRELAGALSRFGLYEDPTSYDLVADPKSKRTVLLWEVKTLHPDGSDAALQARLGLGQLLYYEHFVLPSKWHGYTVRRAALFEHEISSELVDFLDAFDVAVFTMKNGTLTALNRAARSLEAEFLTA